MNVVKQKESEMGCTEEAQKTNKNMTKPAHTPQGKFISIHINCLWDQNKGFSF